VPANGRMTKRTRGPAFSGDIVREAIEYTSPKTKWAPAR